MLDERAKRLLDAPKLTRTQQGVDSYPRVIRQDHHGDKHLLVTFALPGLRRVKVLVPETEWVNGHHLSMHTAMVTNMSRVHPPLQPDPEDADHFLE